MIAYSCMLKHITFGLFVSGAIPVLAVAADPLVTSDTYLTAIIPIFLVIAIILFFAFLGKNY